MQHANINFLPGTRTRKTNEIFCLYHSTKCTFSKGIVEIVLAMPIADTPEAMVPMIKYTTMFHIHLIT